MFNQFVVKKVNSFDLGLTVKQLSDFILNLSYCYEQYPDTNLDRIIRGVKERDIYYDCWILGIDVMN